MVKFPDIASQLPANIAAVPWWYEPDPDPLYTKWLQPLASHHVPLFVATGVNMWSEMTPDFEKTSRKHRYVYFRRWARRRSRHH